MPFRAVSVLNCPKFTKIFTLNARIPCHPKTCSNTIKHLRWTGFFDNWALAKLTSFALTLNSKLPAVLVIIKLYPRISIFQL